MTELESLRERVRILEREGLNLAAAAEDATIDIQRPEIAKRLRDALKKSFALMYDQQMGLYVPNEMNETKLGWPCWPCPPLHPTRVEFYETKMRVAAQAADIERVKARIAGLAGDIENDGKLFDDVFARLLKLEEIVLGGPVPAAAKHAMSDERKVASEAEVVEAMREAMGRTPGNPTAWMTAALTAARALGVLLPEEAAALRKDRDRWMNATAAYASRDESGERDALAARVRVLEETMEKIGAHQWWGGSAASAAAFMQDAARAARVRVLEEACAPLLDDYQTSEGHHPKWVLVPKATHDYLRAALSPAARPTPDETPTKAWLVERSDLGGQTRWMRQLGRDWEWTTDANEATRFVSQQDAENWCGPRGDSPLRVAEHVWLDAPMPDDTRETGLREAVARAMHDDADGPDTWEHANSDLRAAWLQSTDAALSALAALGLAVVPVATLRAMQEAATDTPEPEDAERALTAIYEMCEGLLLAASPITEVRPDGE